jgi:hypothetical protein
MRQTYLLVQYTWRPVVQVDTAGGLLLVLLGGACKTHRLLTMCELLRRCGARWIAHITPRLFARSDERLGGGVSAVLRPAWSSSAAPLTLGTGCRPRAGGGGSLASAVWWDDAAGWMMA